MKIGTKSVLFGAHCFFIHPLVVLRAWWILYGFPYDPRIWFAAFFHDFGYVGKSDMDGVEGEAHPELGARIMGFLFGKVWGDFTLYHSRFYAKKRGHEVSQLCVADKYAVIVVPAWLYIPMVRLTGEVQLYRNFDATREDPIWVEASKHATTDWEWFAALKGYMVGVVAKAKPRALGITDLAWQATVDRYVELYGEKNRDLIVDALIWLEIKDGLDDRDKYIASLCCS